MAMSHRKAIAPHKLSARPWLRLAVLLGPLAITACAERPGVSLRDPETGAIATVCGPLRGTERAIAEAQRGCVASFRAIGWSDASGS